MRNYLNGTRVKVFINNKPVKLAQAISTGISADDVIVEAKLIALDEDQYEKNEVVEVEGVLFLRDIKNNNDMVEFYLEAGEETNKYFKRFYD